MKVPKKVTDFIKLDAGNIGRRSAVVTGAALAASVLGTVLMRPQEIQAYPHCDCHGHTIFHIGGWCYWAHFHGHMD